MADYYKHYKNCKNKYIKLRHQFGGSKKPILLAFDFDQTISKLSLPGEIIEIQHDLNHDKFESSINTMIAKKDINNIMSDPFLDKNFIEYLRNNKNKNNVKIAIISYGVNSGIKILVNKLKLNDIFDEIITPINFNLIDGIEYFDKFDGKNKIIELLQDKYGIPDSNVMLVDDHITNIKYAQRKYKTSYIPNNYGITEKNVNDIKQFIDNQINNP